VYQFVSVHFYIRLWEGRACTCGAYKNANFFSLAKEAGRVPVMFAKLLTLPGAHECGETKVVQDGHCTD
jgi:hypothetical protein